VWNLATLKKATSNDLRASCHLRYLIVLVAELSYQQRKKPTTNLQQQQQYAAVREAAKKAPVARVAEASAAFASSGELRLSCPKGARCATTTGCCCRTMHFFSTDFCRCGNGRVASLCYAVAVVGRRAAAEGVLQVIRAVLQVNVVACDVDRLLESRALFCADQDFLPFKN
jgi:hypothetical protein